MLRSLCLCLRWSPAGASRLLLVAGMFLLAGCSGGESASADNVLVDGSISKSELKVKPKWKEILRVRNKKNHKTKPFRISGSEWKIRWRTKPRQGATDEEFIIILYDQKNQDVSEIIANVSGEDEDFTFLEGTGDYVLDIKTDQPYELIVEEVK